MTNWRVLLSRFSEMWRKKRIETDLDEELRIHLDLVTDEFVRRGYTRDDARVLARREFGGTLRTVELVRDRRGFPMLDTLVSDARHAVRLLLKTPSFTIVAVVTLALGIGVNAAIFSLVDAVMLRGLPYPEPDRVVSIWEASIQNGPDVVSTRGLSIGGSPDPGRMTVAPADLVDYRRDTSALAVMAGVTSASRNLTGNGAPERLLGEEVTHEYLDVLGAAPASGRLFSADEDQPGKNHVVLLSDGLWRRRFGADPTVVGRTVTLDFAPYEVVGVMPAHFVPVTEFASTTPVTYWVPAGYDAELLANRGDHEINVIGRLAVGATLGVARQQLQRVMARLARESPETSSKLTVDVRPLRDDLVRNVRTSLVVLLLSVGLILLIACVNVANLMIIRAVSKRHEVAVRFALGASRWRVMSGLLAQSVVLAALGGAAGLALGAWTVGVLVRLAPATIPRLQNVGIDADVFLFTAAAALATTVFFGVVPAWQVGRARPIEAIRGRSRSVTESGVLRWRAMLMVTEVALSTILLVGAGLMIRSFVTLNGVQLGFDASNVLAMNVALPQQRYRTADQKLAFYEALADKVALHHGVQVVGFANRLPLRGGWSSGIEIDGRDGGLVESDFQAVSPGYFGALGIVLERGRLVASTDRKTTDSVAVVSDAFSRQFLNGADPIGRRFRRAPSMPWITIVGVVADVRRAGRLEPILPQVYLPAGQTNLYPVWLADLAVRTDGDPRPMAAAIQQDVWSIDKDLPITNVRTLDEILFERVADQRFQTLLFAMFAALALTLAVVGIYGVVAYAVSQRTPEIGVRMALGASRGTILRWIVGQAAWLVAIGAAAGLAGALGLSRYVATLLFEVGPTDMATYAAAAVLLGAVAVATSLVAGRGATKVDPVIALRDE